MKKAVFTGLAAVLALLCVLVFSTIAFAQQPRQDTHVGLRAGYNFPNMVLGTIYEEHPNLNTWHLAGYAAYDFGMVKLGGTLWNYFLSAPKGIWRTTGSDPIDQTYAEELTGGVFGPTVDVSFDFPVTADRRLIFNPGIGLGMGFRYGDVKQYDYESKPGVAVSDKSKLTQDQIRPEDKDNGKKFMPVFPLLHIDADWTYLIDKNWFAMGYLGFQTFGPTVGAGFGYQFY
jgi:hypothetical protein